MYFTPFGCNTFLLPDPRITNSDFEFSVAFPREVIKDDGEVEILYDYHQAYFEKRVIDGKLIWFGLNPAYIRTSTSLEFDWSYYDYSRR